MSYFKLASILLLATAPSIAFAQPGPGKTSVQHASLEITSTTPAAPVTGERVVFSFVVRNNSVGPITLTGEVVGSFQDEPLTSDSGATNFDITLAPSESVTGSLGGVATATGASDAELTFRRSCKHRPDRRQPPCKPTPYTATTTSVTVAQKMLDVRIAGFRFLNLSKGGSNQVRGGLCVVHSPGCGVVGKDGEDRFFGDLPLPPGVTLVDFDFQPEWPAGLTAVDRGGLGSQGSYGARVSSSGREVPVVVRWENACQGKWAGLPVIYGISFVVRIPDGMDLGEPISNPNERNVAVCDRYDFPIPTPTTSPPTEQQLTIGLFRRDGPAGGGPRPYSGQFGLVTTPAGKITGIQNAENFAIELVGDSGTTDDCGKSADKTVVLSPLANVTTGKMEKLFGSEVRYPRAFVACSYVDQGQIAISLTYKPD